MVGIVLLAGLALRGLETIAFCRLADLNDVKILSIKSEMMVFFEK